MDPEVLATFHDSFHRCKAVPGFFDSFYKKLLSSSDEVREKFADTDFERQKRVLRNSFYLLMLAAQDKENGPEEYLEDIAIRHDAEHLDVAPHLYSLWLECLLHTVQETDPNYSAEVEEAWRELMNVGVLYLISQYRRPSRNGTASAV
jgi:hemoglobin-like flavoprotein